MAWMNGIGCVFMWLNHTVDRVIIVFDVGLDLLPILHPVQQAGRDLAVRSQDHEGDAVDGLDAGGVDGEITAAHQLEVHFHTGGLADPVALDFLGGFRPVDFIKTFQQLFCKGRLVTACCSEGGEKSSMRAPRPRPRPLGLAHMVYPFLRISSATARYATAPREERS